MGLTAHILAMEEISRASASIGLSSAALPNLCVNEINLNVNNDQKKQLPTQLDSRRDNRFFGDVGAQCRTRPRIDVMTRRQNL